ncbi:MAG: hypothetical protein ACOY31_04450 [Bacillota bacterium]
MFPQTHVFFAGQVMGKMNDAVALGSIFPDMAIGAGIDRDTSHGCGRELLKFMEDSPELRDFALACITHGVDPGGLDYYGDEKNHPSERGYCFEKGRVLVNPTIAACNIPREMGWWKAHNIVEMGIELRISACGSFGQHLRTAFDNQPLIEKICRSLGEFFDRDPMPFIRRISGFRSYIDLSSSTAESLAEKYQYQMYYKHRIQINVREVAGLIRLAAEVVEDDVDKFFLDVTEKVKETIVSMVSTGGF